MKAVVVDDSMPVRVLLGGALKKLGFSVKCYPSADAALEELKVNPTPDVVLVDWNMPGMSGIDLIAQLRSMDRFEAVFVMMVSSESRFSKQNEAFEAGADEFLMKPFTPDSLRIKLELLGFVWDKGRHP